MTQKPHSKILIKNAGIIDKQKDIKANLLISNGIIESILNNDLIDKNYSGCKIIDAKGLSLMPAMYDLHCHFREPGYEYKEDIISGLKAALKGGYCFTSAMANTNPVADNIDIIAKNNAKAKGACLCGFNQISAMGINLEDKTLVDVKNISKYTKLFSNDGRSVFSDEFMQKALIASRENNFIIAAHCEPETEIIERHIKLLKKTGGNLHICHVSKKESINLIRKAKEDNLNITCEATPHHLFSYDIDYKVNPPIGSKEDNDALIQAVKDGTVDILATDHAPHSEEDKLKGSPGISNIETAFSMYLKVFKENNISLKKFCAMSSFMPAKMVGLDGGIISPGKEANFIIADTENMYKIDKNTFVSKSNNTPFDGRYACGKVIRTYIKGELIYDSGQII